MYTIFIVDDCGNTLSKIQLPYIPRKDEYIISNDRSYIIVSVTHNLDNDCLIICILGVKE